MKDSLALIFAFFAGRAAPDLGPLLGLSEVYQPVALTSVQAVLTIALLVVAAHLNERR